MARILIIGDPTNPLVRARGLLGQRAGHQIFWFSVQRASLPDVTHFFMPLFAQKNSVIRAILRPVYLLAAIKKTKPDIIHVHYAQTGIAVFLLMNFHPLIVTVMGGDILPERGYYGIPAFFIRMLLENTDCITSKSDFMDKALDKIGNYRHKIRRVTWGVDLDHFHPNRDVTFLRAKLDIPANDFVFFDARLARPLYNKHIIIEAFASYLREGGSSATLLVAESFPDTVYLDKLRQQVSVLGIAQEVRFVGAIPHGEIADYYVLADLTISVPSSDGLPQTLYEAYACGSFLILGDLPQYNGVVEEGVTARLVSVGDVNSLKDAISWISRNPEIRNRAKKLGRDYVEKYADSNFQADLVNQIYDQFLRTGNKKG
ncbi:MAG: glycosyltransferase family 4 protein [Anaerolineales bacterium]|nr:glycosyltransferase family 4 protein [Anaerolineales bacterium]